MKGFGFKRLFRGPIPEIAVIRSPTLDDDIDVRCECGHPKGSHREEFVDWPYPSAPFRYLKAEEQFRGLCVHCPCRLFVARMGADE